MIFKSITGYFSGITAGQQALNIAIGQGFKSANIDSYVKSLNGLSLAQQRAVITSSGLTKAQQKEMLSRVKNTAATDANTGANIKNAASDIADANANDINSGSTAKNTGLVNANTGAKNANTGANIKNAGSATSNLLAATGLSGIGNALKGVGTALLAFVKVHPVITAITAALTIGGIAVGKYKKKQKEAAKEIKEAYEKAKTEIDEINSSFKNTKSRTKEISQEYAELAQGVNLLTNENNKLSTEKYERFLELSNELSSLYPSLTKDFDENGNAILNLSGNVDTIVSSLNDLVSVQEQLSNQEIVDKMPDLFKGYSNNVASLDKKVKTAKKTKEEIEKAYEVLNNWDSATVWYYNGGGVSGTGQMNTYIDALEALGIAYKKVDVDLNNDQYKHPDGLYIDADYDQYGTELYDIYIDKLNKAANDIKYSKMQLESETSSINQYLNTWLQTEFSYVQLEDNGLKQAVQDMLFNFDWSALPKDIDANNWEEVSEYLRRNILFAINNIDDVNISNALSQIFSNAELTPEEKLDYIQQVQDYFGEDSQITLSLNPILGETEVLQNQYNDAVGKFGEDEEQKLKDFFKDRSINTDEEIDYWNEVTKGARSASEAIEMYNKAKEKEKPQSFIELLDKDEYKEIKKELLELAKSGEITEETLKSTEEYNKLLDDTETSARAAKNQILDMLTTQEKTAGVSQGLDKLKSAYEEFKDEDIGFVTAETLESLPEVFKNMNDGKDFDLFSKIVGDPTSTSAQVQKAFNDLVTAYVNDQRLFSNIAEASESEINSLIANLKHMGITNAEEVVNNTKKNATSASYLINEVETEYAEYLSNKDGYDEEYFNSVMQKNSTLINELGGSYKTDYDNWCELLMKKAEAYNEFVNAINSSGMFNTTSAASKYYTEDSGAAYLAAKKYLEEAQEYNKSKTEALMPGNMNSLDIDVFGEQKYTAEGVKAAKAYIEEYEAAQAAYEKLNLNLTTIPTDFGTLLNFDGSDKDDSSEPEDIDWIETLLNNTSEALDKVKDKVDDTYSTWEERNKSLQKAIADTRNAIALQAQAEATYRAKAESIALPEYYKTLVRSGNMSIQDNVDENTSKLISEYKEWYEKAKACGEAQDELNASLKELETISKMDLVEGKYDALYSKLDNSIDKIQSTIDKAELQGMFANENYYNSMIGYTQSKINNLKKERVELSNIMNMSGVQNDTEAWSEMYQKLMDVDSEILTLENDIIGFNNDIRNLNWEIFEYLEESISRITDESQYLIDLISHEDLFDKDTGKFTKYSDATLGLHAVNYDTYKQQAQDYYEEVQELQRQLVNGAGQEVLEQYNKMVDAHQDAVLAAEDEKQAMLDLIEEGYNAQLEAIQKIIDKKKEQMNQEKDLYDYQKSIAEKTKNIASLEKQKLAYEGDDSEEGMSRIQQIKVELEEAKADLEQTEYEKYLDDSQRMLDELTQDYEDWMNERLDDEDALLKEIVSGISNKGDEINNTLQTVANENGTFISDTITSIFDANSPFTSELSSIKTNTAGTTNAINDLINKVVGITGAQTKGNAGGTSGSNGNSNGSSNASGGSNKTPSTPTTPSTPNNTNANKNASNNSSKGEYDGIFIYKKYSPQQLNTNTSLVDRLKSKNIDASWEARAKYWSKIFGGAYTGSESQNVKFLNWLKSNGYKSGTSSAKKGLHWTQENGEEFIIRKSDGAILTPLGNGDMVFDNEASRRLWELSQNPEKYLANMAMPQLSVGMPNYSGLAAKGNVSQTMEVRIDGISIELPGITNYEEFRSKFIKDGVVMDAIFTSVNNNVMNKNPLAHLQYSRRR